MVENLVENGETDGTNAPTSLEIAAKFIHSLDNAFAEMSSFAESAAVDAEGARKSALAASEVAKLYTSKDYRKHSSLDCKDSLEDHCASINVNRNAIDSQGRIPGISPIDQEFSLSGIDDSTTIETSSNFQNETYYEERCNWKADERSEEAWKFEKNSNGSEGKLGDALYQNGNIKMVDEITLLVKEDVSDGDCGLNGHLGAPQCQDGSINIKNIHNGERESAKGSCNSTCENQNNVINENERKKEERKMTEVDSCTIDASKYDDVNTRYCFDHVYGPMETCPVVDFLPPASKHVTSKTTSTSSPTYLLCQDNSETSRTLEVDEEIQSSGNDQQQENGTTYPLPSTLPSTVSSQQKSLSSFTIGQSEWTDPDSYLLKSDQLQKSTIPNRKEDLLLEHHASPLTVKSFQDKEVTKFSTGQLSAAEIANSHAQDVLSLSLELQRMKERYKAEAESNSKARSALEKEKKKTSWLSAELRRKNSELKETKADLLQSQYRVKAAEEDAEQALSIAKKGSSNRKELEILLNNALNEVEELRNAHNTHERKAIKEDEKVCHGTRLPVITEEVVVLKRNESQSSNCTTIITSPSSDNDTSRSIISEGRCLLRRVTPSNLEDSSSRDGTSSNTESHWLDLKRKTADKRRKLREKLKNTSNDEHPVTNTEIVCYSSRSSSDKSVNLKNICRNVAMIVRKSGKVLNIDGRWFRIRRGSRGADELDLESMTTKYCKTVEVLIKKYQKEVADKEAFNLYLERQIAKS